MMCGIETQGRDQLGKPEIDSRKMNLFRRKSQETVFYLPCPIAEGMAGEK